MTEKSKHLKLVTEDTAPESSTVKKKTNEKAIRTIVVMMHHDSELYDRQFHGREVCGLWVPESSEDRAASERYAKAKRALTINLLRKYQRELVDLAMQEERPESWPQLQRRMLELLP